MQIKSIRRYHFTPKVAQKKLSTSVGQEVEKQRPSALLVGMVSGAPLWKSLSAPHKVKQSFPYDPVMLLLAIHSKGHRYSNKDMDIHSSTSHNSQRQKQVYCPSTNKYITYTESIYIQRNVGYKRAYDMGEPWKDYSKLKNPIS